MYPGTGKDAAIWKPPILGHHTTNLHFTFVCSSEAMPKLLTSVDHLDGVFRLCEGFGS